MNKEQLLQQLKKQKKEAQTESAKQAIERKIKAIEDDLIINK